MKLSVPFLTDAETSALVVYVNCAVALGLAGRLLGSSMVTLAPVEGALEALARPGRIDVVVLCPYLNAEERAALNEACRLRAGQPPCVEIVDMPGRPATLLRPVDREPSRRTAAVGRVLEALAS